MSIQNSEKHRIHIQNLISLCLFPSKGKMVKYLSMPIKNNRKEHIQIIVSKQITMKVNHQTTNTKTMIFDNWFCKTLTE